MMETATKHDPYAPWRYRDFRYFQLSWFALMFSKNIERLAVGVYFVNTFSSANAALALGGIGLVQALPVMLLAIAGGQLADRFDRRRLMMTMLGLGTLVSVGLLIVALTSGSPLMIYILLGLGAVSQALGSPARASMLPQLLPREIFANAIAWNSIMFYMSNAAGLVVGGAIMTLSNEPAPAFAAVVACRIVALGGVWMIRYRQHEGSGREISWQNVVAGLRFVWKAKLILATITLDMFAVLLGGATYLLPIYAINILKVGPSGLGFLCAADAIGAMCMSVALVHLPPMRRAGVAMMLAVAGFGLATIVFGLSTSYWLSLTMMFAVGALDNISVVVRHTLVQMLTPDEMRGRVSAVNSVFIVASNDLGGLESGLTAWLFGPVISVVGGGVGTILVVICATLVWPQILALGSLQSIQPMEDEEETARLM